MIYYYYISAVGRVNMFIYFVATTS